MDWVVWRRKGLGLTARPQSLDPRTCSARLGFKSFLGMP